MIAGDIPGDDGDSEGSGVGSDEEIRERCGLGAAALAVDFIGLGGEEESFLWKFEIAESETNQKVFDSFGGVFDIAEFRENQWVDSWGFT